MKRLYPDHPIVGVGAVIINNGRILLEKRKNEPGKGKWSIPGGVVEVGEELQQALEREVKEETGLNTTSCSLIDVVDSISLDDKGVVKFHFVIVDYLVKTEEGVPEAASDADELRWVPISEVQTFNLTESFRLFFGNNRVRLSSFQS